MELKYKTRGDSGPQGKPRVYFTAHPADYGLFLEGVSAEILARQNCAVWYDAEPEADWDEETLSGHLGQMQLFVIPVTTRFLCQPSRALDVEFRFAREHHIPILPLMQESGLEELFNQKCGDLQTLDKTLRDDTAIPYEQKLEKILSSVLVSDELAARIRKEFDAYVFLSYRKKDRKHAQELMRLIHKNEMFRDIAIWYDEFLTPGENFNDAIADALKKSRLFILTVTPNAVDGDNYIMTTEYPMAKDEGKPILPAELVPTDKQALKACYRDIPDCVDVHDEPVLSDALLEALRKMAIVENDKSPEHNYLIGLAYLKGVDMEVDHQRGLSLITGAAEDGWTEATEQMVGMYRSGEGVDRNLHKAIQWQERLASQLGAQLGGAGETYLEDALQWISAIRTLGSYCYESGDLKRAESAFAGAADKLERLLREMENGSVKRDLSDCCIRLGDIRREEGRLEEAGEEYRKALELLTGPVETEDGPEMQHGLSVALSRLALLCVGERDWQGAERYYHQAFWTDRKLYNEIRSEQTQRNILTDCSELSHVYLEQKDLDRAGEYAGKALDIARQRYEELKTPEAANDLCVCCIRMGSICEKTDRLEESETYYRQSMELSSEQLRQADTVCARENLAASCRSLGSVCKTRGRLEEAEAWYQKSLELGQRLAEETGFVRFRQNLSLDCRDLGGICRAQGRLEAAEDWYRKSEELARQMAEASGSQEDKEEQSYVCQLLGGICRAQGRLEEAGFWYQEALKLHRQMCEEAGTAKLREELTQILEWLGDLCREDGCPDEAVEYYLQEQEILEALCEEEGAVRFKRELLQVLDRLGDLYREAGCLEEAGRYYLREGELLESLCQSTQVGGEYRLLFRLYIKLGAVYKSSRRLRTAARYFQSAVRLSLKLYETEQTTDNYSNLASAYYYLGILNEEEPDRDMLRQAWLIWDQLRREHPEDPRFAQWCELAEQ